VSALDDVLDALARAVDDEAPGEATLGEVTLRTHQIDAVRDLRASLAEFGGALLADDPGFGKTYTALAIARDYSACLVAAPASLRAMWRDACARARITADFISLELLSRGRVAARTPLVIVDEAHRAANPTTARYRAIAMAVHGAHALLLTATPVRNRGTELDSLIGLFLGIRTAPLDHAARARCVIRRSAVRPVGFPAIASHAGIRPRGGRGIAASLRTLPEPLPIVPGLSAASLVRTGLARYWSSSEAALERALVRRMQRGFAIRDLLDAGEMPSRDALRAWVVGDDATQLPFAFGTPAAGGDTERLRQQLNDHLTAVRELRDLVRQTVARDCAWRAAQLREICSRHDGEIVVAFTNFEATASALFGALRSVPGTVLMTSRGARTAGGAVDRAEIIAKLGIPRAAAHGPARFDVRIVVATDLLSEGVNLQGASVVVHLDQPWTPAAVAQRVGRAARLESVHDSVHEYRFLPSHAAEGLLEMPRYHARKREAARDALAAMTAREQLRQLCSPWRLAAPRRVPAVCAAARASWDGFIARIESPSRAWIVASRSAPGQRARITDDPAAIARLAAAVIHEEAREPSRDEVDRVARAIARWLDRRRAALAAGSGMTPSPNRRRILSRLDALLDGCPASRRPVLAARIGRLRAILIAAGGAALEMQVSALLGRTADAGAWLDEAERRLSGDANPILHQPDRAEVAAVLVLRKSPPSCAPLATAAAVRAPLPCPPATSTGTAAPR
jgi:superfamily II DNA or RNA helicase